RTCCAGQRARGLRTWHRRRRMVSRCAPAAAWCCGSTWCAVCTTAGSRLIRAWEDGYMMTKGGESPLPKRALGATSLMVHPLCFGTAELGDLANVFPYAVGEEQAVATARAILDGPINYLDTAAGYGASERRIGIALRERGG